VIRAALAGRLGGGGTGDVGRRGERAAARYLARRGLRVLGRNLETTAGEADLLCEDPVSGALILVEVKARRRGSADRSVYEPERQINAFKRGRLLGIARALRRANGWHDRPFRIDVVAVEFVPGSRRPVIRHHVNAVSGC
jgi:putative endonuclease